MKYFVISDVHGEIDSLTELMEKISWRPDIDILIFLGDYIDRGDDSKEVIRYVRALKKLPERFPENLVCLMGNHERMFLDYLQGNNKELFLYNGGDKTLESYSGQPVPSNHIHFIKNLKLYHETDDYIFVHAGLRDHVPLGKQDEVDLLWVRDDFIYSDYDHGKKVIFGHTPQAKPLIMDNKIGIDTGCVFGGKLTCLVLPDMEFIQV